MPNPAPWPTIHAERKALAADLRGVDDSRWSTPSWCDQWSVRDVLAHMTATARKTAGGFLGGLIGSGFSFEKMVAKDIERELGGSPAATLANFESVGSATTHPPGPIDTWLGETLVHAEDVRRPLGLQHEYPTEAAVRVADFYKGSNLIIGAKRRISGVRLSATDTEWSTGSGPDVMGPIMSLVMVMTGRRQALEDLSGEGVAVLRDRR